MEKKDASTFLHIMFTSLIDSVVFSYYYFYTKYLSVVRHSLSSDCLSFTVSPSFLRWITMRENITIAISNINNFSKKQWKKMKIILLKWKWYNLIMKKVKALKAEFSEKYSSSGSYKSHSTNTLGKGMNLIILPPAMGKYEGRLGSSGLERQLV